MGNLILQFDEERMLRDLMIEVSNEIIKIADTMALFMEAYSGSAELAGSFRYEIIEHSAERIDIAVGSDNWNAFIENYGMGSLMAKENQNPFLADYKSNFFHSYRWSNNAITARPQGYYWRPNWDTGDGYRTDYAQGRIPAGTNLETDYTWKNYNVKIRPKAPKFFMEKAFDFFNSAFPQMISEVLERFPMDRYIKGGG